MANNKKAMVGLIIGMALLIIVLIIAGFAYTVFSASTITAQLHVESGTVKVNDNTVTDTVKLFKGDVVESTNGMATIILHENVLVSLQPNTKVTLDDLAAQHPKVTQQKGTTWNKFMRVTGMNSFSISTSTSVASVRGTSFVLSDQKIMTSEGTVAYETEGKTMDVFEMTVAEKKGTQLIKRGINSEEKAIMKKHFERIIKELKQLRAKEIAKHNAILTILKQKFKFDDEQMQEKLDEMDSGKSSIDSMMEKMPFSVPAVEKIAKMTKEIQQMNSRANQMNQNGEKTK